MIQINSNNFKKSEISNIQNRIYQAIIRDIDSDPLKKIFLQNKFKIMSKNKINFNIEEFIFDMINIDENLIFNDKYYVSEYVISCKILRELYLVTNKKSRERSIKKIIEMSEHSNIKVFMPRIDNLKNKIYMESRINNDENYKKLLDDELFKLLIHLNNLLGSVFNYTKYIYRERKNLLVAMNVNVCPYCNESELYLKNEKPLADLDHFFVQSIFPLLGLSLGNYIPSCVDCNRTLKGKSTSEIINPRLEGFGNLAYFNTNFIGYTFNLKDVEIQFRFMDSLPLITEQKIKNSIELFDIESRYNNSDALKQFALDMYFDVQKIKNPWYRDLLESIDEDIKYLSDEEYKRKASRIHFKEEEIINVEQGKYKNDLFNQLNTLHLTD